MTHMEFHDYRKNGEGLSIFPPGTDGYLYAKDVALIFHIETVAAHLDRADIVRLRDGLTEFLNTTTEEKS